jgi:hypothetical protein
MSQYLRAAAAIAGAIALAPGLARADDLIYFATSHQGNAVYQVATGGSYSTYATGITNSWGGLTFDANKNLYVSSGQNVLVIAPGGGTPSVYSGAIVQPPAVGGARPFFASGLAFNAAGALFVGAHEETGGPDPANNAINKIAPGGGSGTSAVTEFATVPKTVQGLAFDSSGNLYAANYFYNQAITKIAPDGTVTPFYTAPNNAAFDTKNYFGLAFDAAGSLFVTNFGDATGATADGTVLKFENTGGVLSNTPTVFASGLVDPHGLAFDSRGNLFVLQSSPGILVEYANLGGVLSTTPTVFATDLPWGGGDIVAVYVPEPGGWAVLLAGLIALGGAMRLRRGTLRFAD